ncbi:protein FLOURY 1-like [Ziziphus jujuba]|uniref:Protein FLOURY 1-like n=1 Tax=Ziziphus jujuba TaxID=326968 RepID=A0A6P4AD16_ZIZJJ|nr:protein FLOURY 1-like [Ziziphus jujuba]
MQILGRFCLLITVCSVLELYRRFLQIFLGFLSMEFPSSLKFLTQSNEFGCGFLLFGYFSRFFSLLGLFLMFGLGLKVLQVSWFSRGVNLLQILYYFRGKAGRLGIGFGSKCGFGQVCYPKEVSCNCGASEFLVNSQSPNADGSVAKREAEYNSNFDSDEAKDVLKKNDDDDDDEKDCHSEDGDDFDAMELRKLVKIERQRAKEAQTELEKERMAAATAAEEAMAMILRLQNEKSCIEMQANQYRRMAEHKQQYDEALIQSLQWIVTKLESEKSLLEDQLKFCRQKLKPYGDEIDQTEQAILTDHSHCSNMQ